MSTNYPYNLPEDHPDRRMEMDYLQEMEAFTCRRCGMAYDRDGINPMTGICLGCTEDDENEL